MSGNILLVEDDQVQMTIVEKMLEQFHYHVQQAKSGQEALELLKQKDRHFIDLVLLDLQIPHISGLEILEIICEQYPDLPVIVLTGSTNINDAVNAMKIGAVDFINKPPEKEHLNIAIKNALRITNLTKEVARLTRKESGATSFSDIIGYDAGLINVVNIARKSSTSNIPVLITGETGVGKELFARAIHGESIRTGSPFIAVNCGAIPEHLVESTLFGHEKGAFTGAINKAIGKFREADGGTIFLDEVGDLPLETQVKLLRALQQKEIEPVGAGKPVLIDVRIISATNKDLAEEIKYGNFREDLFFRLNVLNLQILPLRERTQDVLPLIHHFIEHFAASENRLLKDLSEQAEQFLLSYAWKGNVRELENIIHRAMVISDNDTLDVEDFSYIVSHNTDEQSSNCNSEPFGNHYNISTLLANGNLKSINDIEQEAIKIALRHNNNNITKAAESLGIAKSTFYRKVKD